MRDPKKEQGRGRRGASGGDSRSERSADVLVLDLAGLDAIWWMTSFKWFKEHRDPNDMGIGDLDHVGLDSTGEVVVTLLPL